MKELAIGDAKNAILIIQQSQTDPQKALAELVENSIDAGARRIRIIRRKRGGSVEIVIEDDGEGVKPGPNGHPDFDRIARGICDSFKRQLDATQRQNVQGEYAIGMLGFAAIGRELEIVSRTAASQTRGMRLTAGSVAYETFAPKKALPAPGTRVVVREVHKEIQNRLTAEKLSRYLGTELRDRIRLTKAQVQIEDKLARGKLVEVRPREFAGEKLAGIGPIKAGGGTVRFELYVMADRRDGRVGVARRGTRLLDDVCQLEELNHAPWDTGQMQGLIHFDRLTTAPASRRGIIPDANLEEFLKTVRFIEDSVSARLKELEKTKEEEIGRKLVRQIQEAFASVLDELTEEYSWFDGGKGGSLPGSTRGKPARPRPVRLSRGPLASVEIVPKLAQLSPGEKKRFTARPLDSTGALIPIEVSFDWSLHSSLASLEADGSAAGVQARKDEGEGLLSVIARKGGDTAQAQARFLILQVKKQARGRKLPFLEPVHRPGESWRSRWVASRNLIEYNTGHPNYVQAKTRARRGVLRYLSLLVAKELVLHNFSGVQQALLLDRMVEIISALQQKL
ncbi:MAG: hypothetical protein GF330_04555 [Candidatus Eisenbacteria bacterium]|nr:hypothetical protein [Candidatus Eisenbacteria bacterium]